MNHSEILKSLNLWQGTSVTIKKFPGGITNFNYLVLRGEEKYVAHFGPETVELLGINRERGVFNTRKAFEQGLGPEIIGYYSEYDLVILRYLYGEVFTPKAAQERENIIAAARLLKKIHTGEEFWGAEDIFEAIDWYLNRTREYGGWMPENMEDLQKSLLSIKKKIGTLENKYPCHLDLVMGNFVKSQEGLKLLDWEYSAQSDYRYDLGAFALYAELDRESEELFLKSYGGDMTLDLLQSFKAVMAFREAAWGILQLVISPIDFDYKGSAEKYFALFERLSVTK